MQDLLRRLEALPALVNQDAALLRRGRLVRLSLLLGVGETAALLMIEEGRLAGLEIAASRLCSWRFALRGPAESWRRHWERLPPPHFHDLFAMAKAGHLAIEGDLQPLMAHLRYFKELLAAPRRAAGAAS